MKKFLALFFISVLILFLTACNSRQEQESKVDAIVSPLSDEEYNDVETHGLDNPTKL
ncbi:hypothetical protein [Aquibacillus sediminis]|uniref:hypothetical protein n=1 Tax=Aquibacillus sediminis TaxID=2574734 RepID=UPI0014875A88|nr:hypothetical protein [Aquibacillus sediminis]